MYRWQKDRIREAASTGRKDMDKQDQKLGIALMHKVDANRLKFTFNNGATIAFDLRDATEEKAAANLLAMWMQECGA